MVKYRKNNEWSTYSFSVRNSHHIDEEIQNQADKIQEKYPERDIDIIDISIRSIIIPETTYENAEEKHFITILYAGIERKKKIEI